MRYSSTAQKFVAEETADNLRDKLMRVTTPCDALRNAALAPLQDFASLIEQLCQQIDETVLPRKFALMSDAGVEATIVVSNRRLIELEIRERKVALDAGANSNAETVAQECAKALRALSLASGPLRVRLIGRASGFTTNGTTCTAKYLLEYSRPSTLQNRLKAFLKESHARSLGWIYCSGDGQAVTHDPDEEIMTWLRSLQEKVVSQGDDKANRRSVERAGPTCSAFAMTADTQVLIAKDGADRLFAVFPTADLATAMSSWHRMFKRSGI